MKVLCHRKIRQQLTPDWRAEFCAQVTPGLKGSSNRDIGIPSVASTYSDKEK